MKKYILFFFLFLLILITKSCIEPFEIDTIAFKENIVVKAILTDEVKNHSVKLFQTIPIDSTKTIPVKNARISIIDDAGNTYNFQETEDGIYTSTFQFAAQPLKSYTLNIETIEGIRYKSTPEKLPLKSEIDDLNFSIELNNADIPELVIKANSILSNNEGQFYRYEYDETFKIKARYWSPRKIIMVSDNPFRFETVLKDPNIYGKGFCYGNQKSKTILITETKSLSEDRVSNFPIRFIPLDSYIIGVRYSLLLKQYVINKKTYDYYELLHKFSDSNNIFSQVQLGNIPSNIKLETNIIEHKIDGFFEVSSVTTKRFFINREDITETSFTNYVKPSVCNNDQPNPFIVNEFGESPLLEHLENGYIYFNPVNINPPPSTHPYLLIGKECGDCSRHGNPIAPDFWID